MKKSLFLFLLSRILFHSDSFIEREWEILSHPLYATGIGFGGRPQGAGVAVMNKLFRRGAE